MSTVREALAAAELIAPVIEDVANWLAGRGNTEPPVLQELPVELRSQAALTRARARTSDAPPGG